MDSVQRDALLGAMMDELALQGYEGMSVERVLGDHGVSKAELEAEFGDKDGCLVAAYERLAERLTERVATACEGSAPWPERVRGALARLLEDLAARPDLARAITRSFPGIRPSAYERYVALLDRFVPLMKEGREYSEIEEELPGEVELLAVGAAEAIIFEEVDAGRASDLPSMMPEILFSVLVPFMGPERAADEMRIAAMTG